MSNSLLIQKQIKDNSEELHNFVRDLKLWEEEMKRKDRQLSNEESEEILPPVRRPKISSKEPSEKEDNENKRISSYDYKRWDKFDVEKACEDLDDEDKNKGEGENDEDSTKRYEIYLKEKALYEKELGNHHVKACEWDKAIEAYTRAISVYSIEPIFFANRALCYLKKKQYDAVEADCTESLKLDPTYVKPYLRRAAAREALGRLEDARYDLFQVLQLEPKNSQAKRDFDRIKMVLTSVVEVKSTAKETDKESLTQECNDQKESVSLSSQIQNLVETPSLEEKKETISKTDIDTGTEKVGLCEPNWPPCSATIEPILKAPHLRSKKTLKRVEIHDVGSNISIHVCARKISKDKDLPLDIQSPTTAPVVTEASSGEKLKSIVTMNIASSAVRDVPPPPNTWVQFNKSWNIIKDDNNLCYRFLKQIPGKELPIIFKESLESRMFSNIIAVLASAFIVEEEPVLQYLLGLSGVRRFSAVALFMTPTDKSNLSKLFDYCINKGECSLQDIEGLRKLYEMGE